MRKLQQLSELIRERNENGRKITELVNRPALLGHVGEYIAAELFNIRLEESAVAKGLDGRFQDEELTGKSVNVKWYAKQAGLLDIREDALPDYYLVFVGPNTGPPHSRGEIRPWHIDSVHLFDAKDLVEKLVGNRVKIGIATSIATRLWSEAELFPRQICTKLIINEEQKRILRLFNSNETTATVSKG